MNVAVEKDFCGGGNDSTVSGVPAALLSILPTLKSTFLGRAGPPDHRYRGSTTVVD